MSESKEDLEIIKLKLEISDLKIAWWKRPGYAGSIATILAASIAFLAAWMSGYFNEQKIALERDIKYLTQQKVVLEASNQILDKRKKEIESFLETERNARFTALNAIEDYAIELEGDQLAKIMNIFKIYIDALQSNSKSEELNK